MSRPITTDVAIIGGGIAGLWVLNLLRVRGIDCHLFEATALGAGQTIASQGMIHGGIKYTLSGTLTPASETIAAMPDRWRRCLSGDGDIDLRSAELLSESYYLFTDGRATSKLSAFFAARALRGRIEKIEGEALPATFRHPAFMGSLYRLNDLVVDTTSVLRALALPHLDRIHYEAVSARASGRLRTGSGLMINAGNTVLAAGEGNQLLLEKLRIPIEMQRRPLNQVLVTGKLPAVYAHAVSFAQTDKPMITITSHQNRSGRITWYLGGALAEESARTDDEQKDAALRLLHRLVPWFNWHECRIGTWRIDRAEPARSEGNRPDRPFVRKSGRTIVCWPTKLTLTPLLGDLVLKALGATGIPGDETRQADAGRPKIAQPPWRQPHV